MRVIDIGSRVRSGVRPRTVEALPAVVAGTGVLSLLAPLGAAEQPLLRVGALLALDGCIEILRGLRNADFAAVRRAVASGVTTLVMALVVINAPFIAGTALVLFLAVSFFADGVRYLSAVWRPTAGDDAHAAARGDAHPPERRARLLAALAALGDFSVAGLLLVTRRVSLTWLVAIAAALRAFGIAWNMAVTPVHAVDDAARTVVDDLRIGDDPAAVALRDQIAAEESARVPIDRRWIMSFIVTLFVIHIARMQTDGTLLGLVAPAIAVLGDMLLAILFALVLVLPVVLSVRTSTRWLERRMWKRHARVGMGEGWSDRLALTWLRQRLRIGMRLREARYSLPVALRRSLATGLPVAAVIAASVPVWGMSWFFDTENWASGMWNSWAESRTDIWRAAMVRAVIARSGVDAQTFAVTPPAVGAGDFSFIVIGDTGEGDASQHVLRDQLLSVAGRPDVRFVVISSDVVYPNGSMTDYEGKFWLPFKGVTKPVYAIPGNHDWYDALEAFLATFLEADAARASMRARAEVDLRFTSTTASRIDALIGEAQRLRHEYDVPTGFQRGPFFELQTDRFALVAIDTGIVKRIDDVERTWLESALARARGKTVMAVIGHPFYAGGTDETADNDEFASLKQLLLDRGATIMMAGDTHDLEYYAERRANATPVHYFVNGGGGAYLSFGTALQWPSDPPTAEWAFYPSRDAVARKIQARTPAWKRPGWWWTTEFGAWPFSAEWLSAAFDYNVAPFFQSFMEVRVEPSTNVIRLRPYGVHGQLRWRDVAHSANLPTSGAGPDEMVEWIVPMR